MKNITLLTLIIGLSSITQAQTTTEVDLDKYTDRCVNTYVSSVNRNGQSDLNGVYLRYNDKENIQHHFRELYFSPDYNLNVRFLMSDETVRTIDMKREDDSYVFYSHRAKNNGNRRGYKFEVEKLDDDTYTLSVSSTNHSVRNKDRSFTPIFDEKIDFRADTEKDEAITKLTFDRIYNEEKALYSKYTELKSSCLKQEYKK